MKVILNNMRDYYNRGRRNGTLLHSGGGRTSFLFKGGTSSYSGVSTIGGRVNAMIKAFRNPISTRKKGVFEMEKRVLQCPGIEENERIHGRTNPESFLE